MSSEDASSAKPAEPTSANDPANEPAQPAEGAGNMSESDYLARQAENAKLAIARALSDAKAALGEGVDPREWTRQYPWVAVGSAIAAGFTAAVLTIPSKRQQEIRRMEKIHRALHPEPEPPDDESTKSAESKPPVWTTILHEAVQLIRPVLVSAVSAAIGSHRAPPSSSGNGHDHSPDDDE